MIETRDERGMRKTDSRGSIRLGNVTGACEARCTFAGVTIDQCVTFTGTGEPRGAASGEQPAPGGAAPMAIVRILEHRVRTGETLEAIASRYGTSASDLARFNWGTDAPADAPA